MILITPLPVGPNVKTYIITRAIEAPGQAVPHLGIDNKARLYSITYGLGMRLSSAMMRVKSHDIIWWLNWLY